MVKFIIGVIISAIFSLILTRLGCPEYLTGWYSCAVFTVVYWNKKLF